MKPFIQVQRSFFWWEIGWFSGVEFKLFKFAIGEALEDCDGRTTFIVLFTFQFCKFIISIGLDLT
jgi:hypothetical protein